MPVSVDHILNHKYVHHFHKPALESLDMEEGIDKLRYHSDRFHILEIVCIAMSRMDSILQ